MGTGIAVVSSALLVGCGGGGQSIRDAPGAENPASNVLNGPGSATHAEVSPDGTRLALMSNAPGIPLERPINFEIYVSSVDGHDAVRITDNDAFDAEVAWSPDGALIAIKSYRDGNDEIYVVSADGSTQTNLTRHPTSDSGPDWSPDGRLIAFDSDRDGPRDIYLMGADGSDVRRLTSTTYSTYGPQWSPDGSRIAFVDGSNVRLLVSTPDSDWYPRWSPDGSTILFVSGDFANDRFDLYALAVDAGAEPRRLVEGVDSGNAAWHPNGERIFFGRYGEDGESRLYSARPDGSDIRRLPAG
jgi:TolB protein